MVKSCIESASIQNVIQSAFLKMKIGLFKKNFINIWLSIPEWEYCEWTIWFMTAFMQ